MMTQSELEARVTELEKKVKDYKFDLQEAKQTITQLETELEAAHVTQHECARCYQPFTGPLDACYCSDDCEHFRKQEPFEVLYRRLHPDSQWLKTRGRISAA